MERTMVEVPIPNKWKEVWNAWDLRLVIILSISLQTILIFGAPLRKQKKSKLVFIPLWFAYLSADWAANYAAGLITLSQGVTFGKNQRIHVENQQLLAFWVPFLLVHLGGPDTITAFALEDSQLWFRHFFGLFFQCLASVYVFVKSLPQNRLWLPTLVMFIPGIMKNVEKTCALYLGSSEADAGSSYTKVIDEYISMKEANLPTKIIMIPEPYSDKSAKKAKKGKLTQLEVVQYGYEFYAKLKGLLNYRIYSRKERDQSRGFFSNRTPEDAFKVVEVELNFIYDVHFTKLPVVFAANKIGLISRVFSLAAIYVAIILFMLESKTNFKEVDVMITYGLLFGALVLDTSALIMLLFCDWTIIFLERYPTVKPDNGFKTKILTTCTEGALHRKFHRWRRWSNSISTFNLIYYCLHPRPRSWKVFDKLGLSLLADDIFYVKTENFSDNLRDFIFEQLKWRSELADDTEITKEINSGRGNWVVHAEHGWDSLYEIVGDVEYDQSLILWHVATEICYNNEGDPRRNDNKTDKSRRISKLLSDYMLYLLIIMQPNMMPAASSGMGQTRFRDTCEEAKRFLDERKRVGPSECDGGVEFDNKKACMEFLKVPTDVKPARIKGHGSKSVLFDSCILAKELMEIEKKDPKLDKWVIISKVWVELLCYGASHSRANMHATQVSKGGELITIVWMMMTHFGLGDHFQVSEGQARAKIVVGK